MSESRRTTFLLGAGASADAGLPLTSELAAGVVSAANTARQSSEGPPNWVRALNATYSGMVGHKGAHGGNPLDAVNIETLISAVRLLQRRHEHEMAPFVASWNASLENIGHSQDFSSHGAALRSAVLSGLLEGSAREEGRIGDAVAQIARAAVRPELRAAFEEAEQFVLRELTRRLSDLKSVDYLAPLTDLASHQVGGVDIISLNYDLAIETAAESRGVKVNRGIEDWRPGTRLEFPANDGGINLLKLHGSLDWHLTEPSLLSESPRVRVKRADDRLATLPWVVVGDREKLATEGPTLDLNAAAREVLLRATHLVVVGYSFSDDHINMIVRNWMDSDPARTMTILDYRWARTTSWGEADFREALLRAYGRRPRTAKTQPIRLAAIAGAAGTHLGAALSVRPERAPDSLFSVEARRRGELVEIDVTLLDLGLDDVSLELRDLEGQHERAFGEHVELSPAPPWARRDGVGSLFGRLEVPHWPVGIAIGFRAKTKSTSLRLVVDGYAPVGGQREEISLAV